MTSKIFSRACELIPGGVNSPVRAFKAVGGEPIFIDHAEGPYMFDNNGNKYIDYVGSWGPMILGHAYPSVIDAVQKTAAKGLSFGAPCELEVRLAEKICKMVPSIEKVRMVNSGTEATMSALRLARGATGRDKIIKFEGNYHGHHDALLVKAGSGALTFGQPSSPGVPKSFTEHTLIAQVNDLASVEKLFSTEGSNIAAIIIEPVAGNMGCIPPKPGFLEGLRNLCDKYGSILIFDEVMSGFRVAKGGAQALYNVTPDLTTLGKVIGGGMPVGAFGGKTEIMKHLAPEGGVYQAGTLSGNPVAMAAGLTTLNEIDNFDNFYQEINENSKYMAQKLKALTEKHDVPSVVTQVGGMLSLFFTTQEKVETYSEVMKINTETFKLFFHGLLERGIYWPPSAFEASFLSIKHNKEIIDETIDAIDEILPKI